MFFLLQQRVGGFVSTLRKKEREKKEKKRERKKKERQVT